MPEETEREELIKKLTDRFGGEYKRPSDVCLLAEDIADVVSAAGYHKASERKKQLEAELAKQKARADEAEDSVRKLCEKVDLAQKALEHIANGGEKSRYVARLNFALLNNAEGKEKGIRRFRELFPNVEIRPQVEEDTNA